MYDRLRSALGKCSHRAYGYSRAQISDALEGILQTRSFHFVDKVSESGIGSVGCSKRYRGDFADYVIGHMRPKVSGAKKR